jgi:branched-chain amino acid transport system permease protein
MLQQFIIYVVVNGGIYALLGLGFSLIFGVARVLNMAHTAFYMVAAYIMFVLFSPLIGIHMNIAAAIIIAIVAVTLLGMASYKVFIDRVREHPAAVLLITIALALALEQILIMIFHEDVRTLPYLISGYSDIFGVRVLNQHLLTLGIVVVIIVGVWLLLSKTKLGVAIRAVANDTEVASLMGINVPRTLMITMGIASGLAAVAGAVRAPLTTIYPSMWNNPLLIVLVVVVIGGLGSIKGSIIGAFIIAFVGALTAIDPLGILGGGGVYLNLTFTLLAMVVVLIVRPAGLFGTLFEEERL